MELKDLLDYDFDTRKIIRVVENSHIKFTKEQIEAVMSVRNSPLFKAMCAVSKVKGLFDKKKIEDTAISIQIRQTHSALFTGEGIPQVGKVYVCNPIDTRRYYETNHFHEEMINHKIYEAEYFLRSLGATKIEITNVTEEESKQSGSVSYNNVAGGNAKRNSSSSSRKCWTSTYSPTHDPFVPDDLTWIEHDQLWKQIAESRLHSGIESFNFEVSTNDDFRINGSLKIPLKNGQVITTDAKFDEFKKSVFMIAAEFKPL